MVEKIIFSLISFLLFAYIFLFKMMKKNDTTYLAILICQAIGILINLIRILFNILNNAFAIVIMYVFSIIIPVAVFFLENKDINCSEWLQVFLAKTYRLLNNDKKAKDILINVISKYDKSYNAHKMLGELGKKDEAIQMLKILVKRKPELVEANKMLAELLLEEKKYKQAITIYVQAIKYDPNDAQMYYDLGIAYSRMNEFSLAKECFKKAVEEDSNYYNAFYRLGQISLLYRDIESAEKYFLESIYGETESKSYYQLAKIYMIKNNKPKAATNINSAIQLDYKYYKTAIEEPIFLPIKQMIIKPKEESSPKIKESNKEKEISDYLDDTYNLTKYLNNK